MVNGGFPIVGEALSRKKFLLKIFARDDLNASK